MQARMLPRLLGAARGFTSRCLKSLRAEVALACRVLYEGQVLHAVPGCSRYCFQQDCDRHNRQRHSGIYVDAHRSLTQSLQGTVSVPPHVAPHAQIACCAELAAACAAVIR